MGTTTAVTMFASLSRRSPKELLQRDSKYVKNTLYIHLIIIIDCVTMSLYIYMYINILIYFPLIQTCRLHSWRKRSYGKTSSKQFKSL